MDMARTRQWHRLGIQDQRKGKYDMSIEGVSAEQFARLFNHHYGTLDPDSNNRSWSEIPLGERSRMIAAVRLALQDLGSGNSGTSSRNERYFAKPGEAEWGC
jgi:hypothetical protein